MDKRRLKVRLSADRLEAWIDVVPGDECAEDAGANPLARAGVVHGVDDPAVQSLTEALLDPEFEQSKLPVARGHPPIAGEDGVLSLRFELGIRPGRMREDGSLDFFDRCLLQPVDAGENIADYRPPTPGKPGLGVDGRPRKARDGRDRLPRFGAGVRMHEDHSVRAEVAGVIHHLKGKLLDVVSNHEHKGEVDLRSGHLETSGSIRISGAIHTRFTVHAGASVDVRREVHCGSVFAGGDVSVGGGIVGGEGARVAARGDVSARFLQTAIVDCGGTLRVAQDIIGSKLRAESVEVAGRLIGGRTFVERSVTAGELGTPRGHATRIMAAMLARADVALGVEHPAVPPRVVAGGDSAPSEALHAAFVEATLVHPGVRVALGTRVYVVKTALRDVRFVYDAEQDVVVVVPRASLQAAS
jgi:uncharacterized protein (DUF342 family)